jgi:hypothetical protein
MWQPVGPLPASVYWRRRVVAMVAVIGVLGAAGWGVAALVVPSAPAGTVSTVAAGRAAVSTPDQGTATTGADPVVPAAVAEPTEPTGSETATATSERLRPDDTPRASVPVPSPVPVPPTGPVPCANDMISVGAEIDRSTHRVGQRPVLTLVVVNISDQPCVRDLDAQRQEIVVWSEDISDRLWSSNDCVNAPSTDLRTLVPGQPVAFSVTWAGRTTTPGCADERTVVPPGSYNVMTRVDDVISKPTPFERTA